MATEQDYIALNSRRDKLAQQHAVLTDREEAKAKRREEIIAQLKEAGVDSSRPAEEIARLEKENDTAYAKAKSEIDKFEAKLNGKDEQIPEELKPVSIVDEVAPKPVDIDDIDI